MPRPETDLSPAAWTPPLSVYDAEMPSDLWDVRDARGRRVCMVVGEALANTIAEMLTIGSTVPASPQPGATGGDRERAEDSSAAAVSSLPLRSCADHQVDTLRKLTRELAIECGALRKALRDLLAVSAPPASQRRRRAYAEAQAHAYRVLESPAHEAAQALED